MDLERRLHVRAFVTGSVGLDQATIDQLNAGSGGFSDVRVFGFDAETGNNWFRIGADGAADSAIQESGSDDRALNVNSLLRGYGPGDRWNRLQALADLGAGGTSGPSSGLAALMVASFGLSFDYLASSWRNNPAVGVTGSVQATELSAITSAPLNIGGLFAQPDGALDTWQIARLDAQRRLHTRAFVTGTVSAELPTGTSLALSGQTKVIQRQVINISGSGGQSTLVAAAGSLRIRVMSMMLIADADTSVELLSGFTGTPVTGPMSLPQDGDGFLLSPPATPDLFHFQTAVGQALVVRQPAAAQLGGWVNYYTEA
jgi:hypothetical protein